MGKSKIKWYGILAVTISFLLIGCSASSQKSYDSDSIHQSGAKHNMAVQENEGANQERIEEQGFADSADYGATDDVDIDTSTDANMSTGVNAEILNTNDKIIRYVDMNLETKEFDKLIDSINNQIKDLGGYIEKSQMTGRHYDSDNLRYGTIVARVPKESVDGFINNLGDIANIVEKEENVENITLEYVDIESHIAALEIEQERLLALLEKAEKLEDIVTLESRLTTVRYELQRYESQIRTFDNQVDFSTITMYIQEVRLMSQGIEEEKTLGSRIQSGLGETLYNMRRGLENFIVWFLINIPYIIIWAILIILLIFIIKRVAGKRAFKQNVQNIKPDDLPREDKD
jgi:uncharacterized protein DUF4349